MRAITLRYAGTCRRCSAALQAGTTAVYERRVGVFCMSCAPSSAEEIREYFAEVRKRRAERYEEWAAKRRRAAEATLHHIQEHYRGDFAFNTQPGYIPERARVVRREVRAFESLGKAQRMEAKAERLRAQPRVAGDAERKREELRECNRKRLKVGMRVDTCWYGAGTVAKINKKTATITNTGQSGTFTVRVDLSHLQPLVEEPCDKKREG